MQWRWILSEYLLKGAAVGWAGFAALNLAQIQDAFWLLALAVLTPLLILFCAILWDPRYRGPGRENWFAKLLLGMIDRPWIVQVFVPVGLFAGILLTTAPSLWGWAVLWGIVGAAMGALSHMALTARTVRFGRLLTLAIVLAGLGLVYGLAAEGWLASPQNPTASALVLIASAGLMYAMTFAGRSEESDIDIAVVCLLLSLGLGAFDAPRTVRSMVILLPVGLYVVYSERIRQHLVVFKHLMRGMDHEEAGRFRDALVSYRLALSRDPKSKAAAEGSWRIHRGMDLDTLTDDAALAELIDPSACLDRAQSLITKEPPPTATVEAAKLADMIERLDPTMLLRARLVAVRAALARHQLDAARDQAVIVLDADIENLPAAEREAAFDLWATLLEHPGLASFGQSLLEPGGHLIDLIQVVESCLRHRCRADQAEEIKPFLYRKLTYQEWQRRRPDLPDAVDLATCRGLGLALAEDASETVAAAELLKIAADGLPGERFTIWRALARLLAGTSRDESLNWYRKIDELAAAQGYSSLSSAEQSAVAEADRTLAETAEEAGDTVQALYYWERFVRTGASGLATRKRLIEIYLSRDDRIHAIRHTRAVLAYQHGDRDQADWNRRYEQLHRELDPNELQSRLSEAEPFFDFAYCFERAQAAFQANDASETVDHFLRLAELGGARLLPSVNFLLGRQHLREGRPAEAAECLEVTIRELASRRRNADEQKIFARASRILGELYVEQLDRPAEAVPLLKRYVDEIDSGADTLFLLARAHEMAGNHRAARKWYDMVLVYPQHPKAAAARESLERLRAIPES